MLSKNARSSVGLLSRGWRCATAGCLATGPMTVFMLATQKRLPQHQHYALPPEIITSEMLGRLPGKPKLSKGQLLNLTLLSHFAYGSAMGSLYTPLAYSQRFNLLRAIIKGLLFGTGVWTGSYVFWMPVMNMSERAQHEPAPRNLMMLFAHFIWGVVMSVLADFFCTEKA